MLNIDKEYRQDSPSKKGSPLLLVVCLILSVAVHAAAGLSLSHLHRSPVEQPQLHPLMCTLITLHTTPPVPLQPIKPQFKSAKPVVIPEKTSHSPKQTKAQPKSPVQHDPPPKTQKTARATTHVSGATHIYKEIPLEKRQSLDELPPPKRKVIQEITAKHHMTWRSLISPDYGKNDFVGHYIVGPSHFVSILSAPGRPNDLILFDSKSGRLHHLWRKEALHYTYGPDAEHDKPVLGVVLFMPVKDDMDQNPLVCWTSRLMWIPENKPAIMADKIKLDETEVVFFNNDNIISGILTRPQEKPREHQSSQGLQPGIVWVQGGGCEEARMATGLARLMAVHGYAFLAFKARGCGDSDGDFKNATPQQIASDILAAHEFMGQAEGIDTNRIGVWGVDEGLLPALFACADSPQISACVLTVLSEQFIAPFENATAGTQPKRPTLIIASKDIMPRIHETLAGQPKTKFVAIDCNCSSDANKPMPTRSNLDQLAPALADTVSVWLKKIGPQK